MNNIYGVFFYWLLAWVFSKPEEGLVFWGKFEVSEKPFIKNYCDGRSDLLLSECFIHFWIIWTSDYIVLASHY